MRSISSSAQRKGRSAKEILVGGLLVFVLMTVVGMASNVVLLLVSYLATPLFGTGEKTVSEQQGIWLMFFAAAMLICMIAGIFFARFIGFSAADYCAANGQERKPDIPSMLLTVLLGGAAHGGLCAFVAVRLFSYLFFAGPVLYLARFLAKAPNSIFAEETLDPISVENRLLAILFYLFFFLFAVGAGYLFGFKKRIGEIEEKEARARADQRETKVWTREDETAVYVDQKIDIGAPKEKRKTLRPETEAFFRRLDRNGKIKISLLIAGWILLDLGIWALYVAKTGRGVFSPYSIAFTALLIPPFYPFRLHEKLLRHADYGEVTVVDVKHTTVARAFGGPNSSVRSGRSQKETPRLVLRSNMGDSEEILFRAGTHLPYAKGDHVFRLGAYSYPVPCDFDELDRVFCPKCAYMNTRGFSRCRECRTPLGRKS